MVDGLRRINDSEKHVEPVVDHRPRLSYGRGALAQHFAPLHQSKKYRGPRVIGTIDHASTATSILTALFQNTLQKYASIDKDR